MSGEPGRVGGGRIDVNVFQCDIYVDGYACLTSPWSRLLRFVRCDVLVALVGGLEDGFAMYGSLALLCSAGCTGVRQS